MSLSAEQLGGNLGRRKAVSIAQCSSAIGVWVWVWVGKFVRSYPHFFSCGKGSPEMKKKFQKDRNGQIFKATSKEEQEKLSTGPTPWKASMCVGVFLFLFFFFFPNRRDICAR